MQNAQVLLLQQHQLNDHQKTLQQSTAICRICMVGLKLTLYLFDFLWICCGFVVQQVVGLVESCGFVVDLGDLL
jgi:hypothetical protein